MFIYIYSYPENAVYICSVYIYIYIYIKHFGASDIGIKWRGQVAPPGEAWGLTIGMAVRIEW